MSKSYKVVLSGTGRQFMTIVVSPEFTLKELNKMIREGINATVVDQRSDIVDKRYVDVE